MRTKLFTLPLYSVRLYVVVGALKGDELHNHVQKKFKTTVPNLKTEVDNCEGCCNRKDDLVVVWLRTLRGNVAMGTLAHEALHATSEVMAYSGMKFHPKYSEEAYTYMVGWMVEEILNWRDKW